MKKDVESAMHALLASANMPSSPVILITGASSGIGAASARLFARNGYRVILAARRLERLETLASEIRDSGGEALAISTDVSHLDQIENMVRTALDAFGQIDVLLNNAGFGRMGNLQNFDPIKDIDLQLNVNLKGAIYATRAVLPHMIERRMGHIINMASIAGFIAPPRYSIYSASKFGLRGFTEGLRREVRKNGIRVSGIYPGGAATEFVQHTGLEPDRKFKTPKLLKLTADDVARTVFSVVKRPRRTVVIPRVMWVSVWLNGLFPGLVDLATPS